MLLTIYTIIWILILITIGMYIVQYYESIKKTLGIKEVYIWVFALLVFFILIYNILLRWKLSKAKKREYDKW